MRYLYIDEAGSSAHEPTTVVAGVIVDADRDYVSLEEQIEALVKTVPEHLRERPKFVPHAKAIFHGEDDLRDGWDFASRRAFITSMVAIAPSLGVPISLGFVRRTTPMHDMYKPYGITLLDHHHMLAFALCVGHADLYITEVGRPREVATIVAENVPSRQWKLCGAIESIKKQPLQLTMDAASEQGGQGSSQVLYTATRIRDRPHFVPKWQNSLLWIADSCAFAYARFLSGGSFGADLVAPIRIASFDALWADPNRLIASAIVGRPRGPNVLAGHA